MTTSHTCAHVFRNEYTHTQEEKKVKVKYSSMGLPLKYHQIKREVKIASLWHANPQNQVKTQSRAKLVLLE